MTIDRDDEHSWPVGRCHACGVNNLRVYPMPIVSERGADTARLCYLCIHSKSGLTIVDPRVTGPHGIVLQQIAAVGNLILQKLHAANG